MGHEITIKPRAGGRAQDVVTAISEGRSIKEIASDWDRSPKTVEFFWAIAKARFGFRSYVDATRYALKQGWTKL